MISHPEIAKPKYKSRRSFGKYVRFTAVVISYCRRSKKHSTASASVSGQPSGDSANKAENP